MAALTHLLLLGALCAVAVASWGEAATRLTRDRHNPIHAREEAHRG